MKKNIKFSSGICAISLFLLSPGAHAAARFSLVGIGTLSTIKDKGASASVTNKGNPNYGGGAQLEFRLSPRVGLEFGVLYLPRKNTSSDSATALSAQSIYNYIQAPIQFRFWLGRFVNIGLGGYYAQAIGNVKSTMSGVSVTNTYPESNMKKADYGLIGSLGLNIPLGRSLSLLAEGRYTMGMADLNDPVDPAGTAKWQDMQALVGFRFGMNK